MWCGCGVLSLARMTYAEQLAAGSAMIGLPTTNPSPSVVDPFLRPDVVPTPFVPYASQLSEAQSQPTTFGPGATPAGVPFGLPPSSSSPTSTQPPAAYLGSPQSLEISPPTYAPAASFSEPSAKSYPVPREMVGTPPAIGAGYLVPVNIPEAKSTALESDASRMPVASLREISASPADDVARSGESRQMPRRASEEYSASSNVPLTEIRPTTAARATSAIPASASRGLQEFRGGAGQGTTGGVNPTNAPVDATPAPVRFSFPQPVIPLESALRRWLGLPDARR